jgi:hypothetical protein
VKSGKPEVRADHPVRWAAALANLARGLHLLAVENSRHQLGFDGQPGARVDYYEPTLFIKTPTLYLFDVATGVLTPTNRLTLGQMFELFEGQQVLRQVDVWAGSAIDDFATRYRTVRSNFETAIPVLGQELVRVSTVQRQRFREDAMSPLARALRFMPET